MALWNRFPKRTLLPLQHAQVKNQLPQDCALALVPARLLGWNRQYVRAMFASRRSSIEKAALLKPFDGEALVGDEDAVEVPALALIESWANNVVPLCQG